MGFPDSLSLVELHRTMYNTQLNCMHLSFWRGIQICTCLKYHKQRIQRHKLGVILEQVLTHLCSHIKMNNIKYHYSKTFILEEQMINFKINKKEGEKPVQMCLGPSAAHSLKKRTLVCRPQQLLNSPWGITQDCIAVNTLHRFYLPNCICYRVLIILGSFEPIKLLKFTKIFHLSTMKL